MKRKLEVNDKAGITLNKNFNSLVVEAGGHEKLFYRERLHKLYREDITSTSRRGGCNYSSRILRKNEK